VAILVPTLADERDGFLIVGLLDWLVLQPAVVVVAKRLLVLDDALLAFPPTRGGAGVGAAGRRLEVVERFVGRWERGEQAMRADQGEPCSCAYRSASTSTPSVEESRNVVSVRSMTTVVPARKIARSLSRRSSAVDTSWSPSSETSQRSPARSATIVLPCRLASMCPSA
jgi:hypothetical protein